jgi:hypothetical protein
LLLKCAGVEKNRVPEDVDLEALDSDELNDMVNKIICNHLNIEINLLFLILAR